MVRIPAPLFRHFLSSSPRIVYACLLIAVSDLNAALIADAGPDQTVSAGDTVQLDGSASTDADGAIVKYRWYQNRGPAVQLDNAQTATPSFQAPPNAELAFGLRVEDNAGAIANDNVVIRVEPNTNQPPIARAGNDQTVTAGDTVQLDGSASTDPDGSVVKYNWYQYRGPSVVLNNRQTATPSFVAPANAILAFGLQAIDNAGAVTNDNILIRTEPYTNRPPVANAGADQAVSSGDTVQLDGGASTDTDGAIVKYRWYQNRGPVVQLDGARTATPSFQAPSNAELGFGLQVEDNAGATGWDSIVIRAEPITNQAPVANAGDDRTVSLGVEVTLDGGASTDADGDIAKYVWWQRSGPSVQLSGRNTATPSFEANAPGEVVLRLRVEDDRGARVMDDVRITVEDDGNRPPTADAGPDGAGVETLIYPLDGAASNDLDGAIASYLWEQLSGQAVEIYYGGYDMPRVGVRLPAVNQDTEIRFRLTVTDDRGLSATDELVIQVLENQPPQPVPMPARMVVEGRYQVMDATSLFTIQPLDNIRIAPSSSYRWRQISGPPVTLQYQRYRERARILAPEVDVATPLVFEISVEDRLGLSATNTMTLNVVNPESLPLNLPPVADAGEDRVNISQQYIVVDGSLSHDPDGNIVSYDWEIADAPEALGYIPGFRGDNRYPINYVNTYSNIPGDYLIRLTVTDDRGGVSTDEVIITVAPYSDSTAEPPDARIGYHRRTDQRYWDLGKESLRLTGSESTDSNGSIVSYRWQQVSGPKIEIANPNSTNTRFIPNSIVSLVEYRFLLTVTDNDGDQDDVVLRWQVGYANSPPTSSLAQSPLLSLAGSVIRLDGSGSYDHDPEDYIAAFHWSQASGPSVTFLDDSAEPLVQLPDLDPQTGLRQLSIELGVTDLNGADSQFQDQETLWVVSPDYQATEMRAGDDINVLAGSRVEITGERLVPQQCGAFGDCPDDSNTFRWLQLSGPAVEMLQSTGWVLSFVAPEPAERETLVFGLAKVISGDLLGFRKVVLDVDPVKVNVVPLGGELAADAGPDREAVERSVITLDGSGSIDPSGVILRYRWEQLEGPKALLSAPNSAVTEAALPALAMEAELLFQLRVVNDWDMEAVDSVRIRVTPDLTDGDIDADGVHDDNDRFPQDPNEAYDYDADGIGDNGDEDRDGDGIGNDADFHPNDPVNGDPPRISVIEPMDDADIDAGYVIVKGTVDGPANTGVTVNGIVAERSGEPYGSEFTARVPLEEGANELQVTATTLSRRQVSQTLTVNRISASPIRFFVSERNGFAPLENRLSLVSEGASPIVQVDIDYEGDGGIDETLVDDFERDLLYLYETEGLYFPTVIVTDADGLQHSLTQVVNLVSEARILAQLENHWSGMNSALNDGNLGLALEHVSVSRSEKYGRLFTYLLPKMPEIIASYSQFHIDYLAMDHAFVHVVRTIGGENRVFTVGFNQDIFGVWRIISM